MSNVRFKCPHCGQMSEGAAEFIGMETECPSCGKAFRLEAVSGVAATRPNGFMCFLGIFRKYVGFRGRASRREFWYAVLFWILTSIIFGVIDALVFDSHDDAQGAIVGLYLLAAALPMSAVAFRRLHDVGKSGWWFLLQYMPVLQIACFVWLATDGDKGPNRFGPDPKGRE